VASGSAGAAGSADPQVNIPVSISIGVKGDDYSLLEQCADKSLGLALDFITVDIAHAHSDSARKIVERSRELFPKSFIIAGNIMTSEAAKFLIDAGANAVKVGIGPGSVCSTKLDTGFGSAEAQASCVKEISDYISEHYPSPADGSADENKKYIIADGGIKHRGDIAKALVVGADMVMIGGRLAGFEESPGHIIQDNDGTAWKSFFGSASAQNKNVKRHVEGRHKLIPLKGSIWNELDAQTDALRSSISYSGGKDLSSLRSVDFLLV
jgi:GMP reductase